MLMENLLKKLPKEIIDLIIQYDGRMKYRNGVYMVKIDKNDDRYPLLHNLPKKEFYETSLNYGREVFMINNRILRETFVFFRNKRYENNTYYSIYFEEQLDPPPYKITHRFFLGSIFSDHQTFILP